MTKHILAKYKDQTFTKEDLRMVELITGNKFTIELFEYDFQVGYYYPLDSFFPHKTRMDLDDGTVGVNLVIMDNLSLIFFEWRPDDRYLEVELINLGDEYFE